MSWLVNSKHSPRLSQTKDSANMTRQLARLITQRYLLQIVDLAANMTNLRHPSVFPSIWFCLCKHLLPSAAVLMENEIQSSWGKLKGDIPNEVETFSYYLSSDEDYSNPVELESLHMDYESKTIILRECKSISLLFIPLFQQRNWWWHVPMLKTILPIPPTCNGNMKVERTSMSRVLPGV